LRPDHSFERQLSNLDLESTVIANYVYAEMAIQHGASRSKKLLNRLNRTPTFWITCNAALQSAAYIAIGRVFDLKSPYNLEALMVAMEKNLPLFGRQALAERKREGKSIDPPWLHDYLSEAYYPKRADVARIRKHISSYRALYDRAFMPVRHQYLAHRQAHGPDKAQQLFARGKVKELWRLSTFLLRVHSALWGLLHNGHRPILQPIRYSARVMYDSSSQRTGPHEYIVRDTKKLMKFIETASDGRGV
jgi:hypothetical protein